MISRTLVINPFEPALMSVRQALGVDLDLSVTFLSQAELPVDPDTLIPQLALLPRSLLGVFAYDFETVDAPGGVATVTVPGSVLVDPAGYSLELYQRRTAENPEDPPVPVSMLGKGVLRTEGSAYIAWGPLGMINVPVVVGPVGPEGPQGVMGLPGPQGIQGIQGIQGEQGDPGPANELTIGTVTTGAPGSPAEVHITGTPPSQVISFVIPSGLTGATGPQGATGANVTLSATAPVGLVDGSLWWQTTTNQLYVREAGVWVIVDAVWGQ